MQNIHLLTCSNRVDVLELIDPVIPDLVQLETIGLTTYDAHMHQDVLIVAPILLGMHDNPRASEIVNHLGSAANLFCRVCMVSIQFVNVIQLHGVIKISVIRESIPKELDGHTQRTKP